MRANCVYSRVSHICDTFVQIVSTHLKRWHFPYSPNKLPLHFDPFHQLKQFISIHPSKRSNLDLEGKPSRVAHYVCSPVDPCKDLSRRAATKGSKPKVCDKRIHVKVKYFLGGFRGRGRSPS